MEYRRKSGGVVADRAEFDRRLVAARSSSAAVNCAKLVQLLLRLDQERDQLPVLLLQAPEAGNVLCHIGMQAGCFAGTLRKY